MECSKTTNGFTSIAIMLLFTALSGFLAVGYSIIKNNYSNVNIYTDTMRSYDYTIMGIEDAESFYYNNKELFYNPLEKSPCSQIGSINNYDNYLINSFNISDTFVNKNTTSRSIGSENLKDDQGFINRTCSIYSKGIPNYYSADFSIQGAPTILDTGYRGSIDNSGYYNIGNIYDNEGMGYFFTAEQLGESEISINLDYNFEKFNGLKNFNIYNSDIYEKVLLSKKNNPSIEISKTNLSSILSDTLSLHSDANLEMGVISFNGTFNGENGFDVDLSSGEVVSSSHYISEVSSGEQKGRILCPGSEINCSLRSIDLDNDLVYFFYLKSFDKPTNFHIDFQNIYSESVSIPTQFLYIKNFGVSNGILSEKAEVKDTSTDNGFFSSFSSEIYNYVYFSNN